MKYSILIFMILFLLGCGTQKKEEIKPSRNILVSILPQKTFVEKIAGDDFKVNVLIPPGTSPAAYSLTPSQLAEISDSPLWFRIGYIGFELSSKDKVAEINPKMKIVDLSEGLNLIQTQTNDGETLKTGTDPHTWLSPALVKEMAAKILKELSDLNPDQSLKYKTNYLEFVKEIDELDIEIRKLLANYSDRKIITFHPSLSYFARDYGLEQHSLESGGKEPTPQRMAELAKLAKKENIKAIYIQGEIDREQARVFAEETKGEVVQVRPLDPAWAENLLEMTHIFVKNFQ